MSESRTWVSTVEPSTLAEVTGGNLLQAGVAQVIGDICTDTRSLQPGQLFWAIPGERFDGHNFVEQAVAAGASGVVIEKGRVVDVDDRAFVVAVDDSVGALGDLAAHIIRLHRTRVEAFLLFAVTGSNGKTTTKEMLATVLQTHRLVLKTHGNFNNWIGMPLTVFGLRPEHQAAVIEMGANAPGEIARMVEIAAPDVSVLTSVAPAHLEGFGSLEGVASAKCEIFAHEATHRFVFPERLAGLIGPLAADRRAQRVGEGQTAHVRLTQVRHSDRGVEATYEVASNPSIHVEIPLLGEHNAWNFGLAIAATADLGYSARDYAVAAAMLQVPGGRMQRMVYADDVVILQDAYNANPASMRAALDVVKHRGAPGHRIVVLGEMRELGADAETLHFEIGTAAAEIAPRLLFAVGQKKLTAAMARGAVSAGMAPDAVICVEGEQIASVVDALTVSTRPGDVVLLKGSRAVALERVAASLDARPIEPEID